jgi:hypothetical protein
MDLLPKYNQRKGRPMSRAKSLLTRQIQTTGNRPLQPKVALISSQDGVLKKLLPPQRPVLLQNGNNNNAAHNGNGGSIPAAAFIPPITVTIQPPQVSARPFLEIGRSSLLIEEASNDSIPQISIPSPSPYVHQEAERQQIEEVDDVGENGHHNDNDSFGLSLFDENSRCDMEPSSRAATSTPSHLQVDHFLDSVLENSSNSLLQTPRRNSPPPSPPGGMSEHSWLPELSLSSFLGSLPNDGGVGAHDSSSKMMMSHHEDSIQSTGSEVDRQLNLMLNENSLDFTSKFAHLASALNSTD